MEITEAELMSKYAADNGIPSDCIKKEIKSKDTIGNALYTKEIAEKEFYKSLLVITSKLYVERCKYIFNKVFGAGYKVKIEFVDPKPYTKEDIKREKEVVKLTRKYFDEIPDGDNKQIEEILFKFHPGYGGVSAEIDRLNRFK